MPAVQPPRESLAINNAKHAAGLSRPAVHFIPPAPRYWLGYVMACGAAKYGWFNWTEGGVVWSVYFDAANRHLDKLLAGEDDDDETGAPHEAHAMACLAILIDAREKGVLHDDRPNSRPANLGPLFEKIKRLMAERLPKIAAKAAQERMEK